VLSHKGVIVHDRNISPLAIKDIIEHGGYGADLSSAEARPETAKDKQNANGIDCRDLSTFVSKVSIAGTASPRSTITSRLSL